MHYDQHCDMEHIVKSLQRLLSRLSALLMVPSCLIAIPAPALSLNVPKMLIDNAVNKKFPKEKYSVKLDNPVLRQRVMDECLTAYLMDQRDAWDMKADGRYVPVPRTSRKPGAQQALANRYMNRGD